MPPESKIFIGNQEINHSHREVSGELVELNGDTYYKISNADQMPPFFMTLSSESDIWMFVSSNGGITAGRKNADHAIFPYYTDDQIVTQSEQTGSKTLFLVKSDA